MLAAIASRTLPRSGLRSRSRVGTGLAPGRGVVLCGLSSRLWDGVPLPEREVSSLHLLFSRAPPQAARKRVPA